MTYFYLAPEVAGGIGENTVMDVSVHPPLVSKLHYSFDGWPDSVILRTFPCYIVTIPAQHALQAMGATGVTFDHVEISRSEFFKDRYPNRRLPDFVWLKVDGKAGRDDFGIAPNLRLVVSQRVLDLFERLGLSDALVEPF
ncbi:MAG: hypothetical protein ACLQJR_28535 [Stellaceae bacterium]